MSNYPKPVMLCLMALICWSVAESQPRAGSCPLKAYQKHSSMREKVVERDPHSTSSGFNSGIMYQDDLGEEGSVVYNEGWMEGKVYLVSGEIMEPEKLCYNIYFQQMQYITGDDTLAFAKPSELEAIQLGPDNFVYTDYSQDGEIRPGYFQVLNEGSCRLLRRHAITHHKKIDPVPGIREKDQYIRSSELYLQQEGAPAEKIRCSKKDLCHALEGHGNAVNDYIKNNKLRIRTAEDMIIALNFYNQLEDAHLAASGR